jgi:hypothetical protein
MTAPSKPQKLADKRAKAAAKKARLAAKLKKGKTAMKNRAVTTTTATASVLFAVLALLALTGCQTADPASRSNRAAYRDIYAEVRGVSNTVCITVGDGLYASADGGGDKQDSAATQTTDTRPEVAVGVGGGSAGTGGAAPQSGIVGDALKKLMSIVGGTAPEGTKLTAEEAAAVTACANGACADPAPQK